VNIVRGTQFVLPARRCGNKRPQGAQSHAAGVFDWPLSRPVRGLGAVRAGGTRYRTTEPTGETPNKAFRDIKRISRNIALPVLSEICFIESKSLSEKNDINSQ